MTAFATTASQLTPLLTQLLTLLLIFLLGLGLGALGGLFGIGGGIIAIPAMVLGLHMDQQLAQGTALVTMAPNLAIAFFRYRQRHPLPGVQVLAMALPAILATYGAARLATGLDTHWLRLCFGGFLLWLGAYTLWRRWGSRGQTDNRDQRPWSARGLPLVGLLGGGLLGLIGVGGGMVATPLLVARFGMGQAMAQGLALALVAPGTWAALGTYAGAGQVDWALGIPLALGGLCSVTWGVSLAHRLPEKQLQTAFALLMLGTAASLMAR